MDQPRQRLACDRCHALKLRCRRTSTNPPDITSTTLDCDRCLKAGALCVYSPQAPLGRPLGSTTSQPLPSAASSGGAANNKRPASRSLSSPPRDEEPNRRPRTRMRLPYSDANSDTNSNHNTTIATTLSTSHSTWDPSMPLMNDILSDEFFSNLMHADTDVWANAPALPGSRQPSMTVHQRELTSGAIQSPLSSHCSLVHDLSVTPDRPYRLHNHSPNHHHHQHQQQQQGRRIDPMPPAKHAPGILVDKCAAGSVAIKQEPILDDTADPVQDVLSRLSSLAVSIHSHSLNVYNRLRLLRTRLDHRSSLEDSMPMQQSSTLEAVAAANDCLSIQALIRMNHSLRDAIRQMKRAETGHGESLPLAGSPSFADGSIANSGRTVASIPQIPYTSVSSDSGMSREQRDILNDPNNSLGPPNSCRLALSLALNCYVEILDIYTMTFNMISAVISHHQSALPINTTATTSTPGSDCMLNTSFSIFTATQITTRLLDKIKGDMRDAWEQYRSRVLMRHCEEGMEPQQQSSKPNPAIQMSFRLSWEKEAVIARLVKEIDHCLSTMMDLT
ncbi:hypothetical protein AJ78_04067 [Emergomyces pasteurianus Ep9510]|uniref:Zn(2)-C6 fungal-type domain-containing protein n=1 Tax=Emergomyces pasteurianus Ep9510 TaxID=1447872 RepID=A0A1J9Q648_9EURO|nr:hypothetical protein AJ78_04067 [Emergomyces pasteurianus Ep9510]